MLKVKCKLFQLPILQIAKMRSNSNQWEYGFIGISFWLPLIIVWITAFKGYASILHIRPFLLHYSFSFLLSWITNSLESQLWNCRLRYLYLLSFLLFYLFRLTLFPILIIRIIEILVLMHYHIILVFNMVLDSG